MGPERRFRNLRLEGRTHRHRCVGHRDRVAPAAQAREFTALWQQHAPRVMAYALRYVEVVADTFLVAWRRLADVPRHPLPWLLVVAATPSTTTAGLKSSRGTT